MLTLAQFHLPTLIAAFAIGLATAWWAFRRPRPKPSNATRTEDSPPP